MVLENNGIQHLDFITCIYVGACLVPGATRTPPHDLGLNAELTQRVLQHMNCKKDDSHNSEELNGILGSKSFDARLQEEEALELELDSSKEEAQLRKKVR